MPVYNELTEGQKAAYLVNPTLCPFCGKTAPKPKIEHVNDSAHKDLVQLFYACEYCGRAWHDVFVLSHIEEDEQTCSECDGIIRHGEEIEMILDGEGPLHTRCGESHDRHTMVLETDNDE